MRVSKEPSRVRVRLEVFPFSPETSRVIRVPGSFSGWPLRVTCPTTLTKPVKSMLTSFCSEAATLVRSR
jgi:hypothetical protein